MTSVEHTVTGLTDSHVVSVPNSSTKIHKDVLPHFLKMQKEASKAGFALEICSGFRGFEAQLAIWNAKATGKRPVLDSNGKPVDISKLEPRDLVYSILRWSGLPGASRHHWGTDFDFFDKNAMTPDYKIQLVPEEYENEGIFSKLNEWLDSHMDGFEFFRPYAIDLGGVSPEPWHISYGPLAEEYLEELDEKLLRVTIENSQIELKSTILQELPNIYRRFVRNISIRE